MTSIVRSLLGPPLTTANSVTAAPCTYAKPSSFVSPLLGLPHFKLTATPVLSLVAGSTIVALFPNCIHSS